MSDYRLIYLDQDKKNGLYTLNTAWIESRCLLLWCSSVKKINSLIARLFFTPSLPTYYHTAGFVFSNSSSRGLNQAVVHTFMPGSCLVRSCWWRWKNDAWVINECDFDSIVSRGQSESCRPEWLHSWAHHMKLKWDRSPDGTQCVFPCVCVGLIPVIPHVLQGSYLISGP